MDSFINSIAREALLMVRLQQLITSFQVNDKNEIIVTLLDNTVIQQNAETSIAFCRGLLEGAKITASRIPKDGIQLNQ